MASEVGNYSFANVIVTFTGENGSLTVTGFAEEGVKIEFDSPQFDEPTKSIDGVVYVRNHNPDESGKITISLLQNSSSAKDLLAIGRDEYSLTVTDLFNKVLYEAEKAHKTQRPPVEFGKAEGKREFVFASPKISMDKNTGS
jgi:hypothetical protein